MKILFLGDIVGDAGLYALSALKKTEKSEGPLDFIIANGENAAGGSGLDLESASIIFNSGVNCITLGNHPWSKKEIFQTIREDKRLLRPANMGNNPPGFGFGIYDIGDFRLCIIPLLGRESTISVSGRDKIPPSSCPFIMSEKILAKVKDQADSIIVELHGDSPLEKMALAHYLDGKVLAVLGSHTHIQSADEKILKGGTAYISDMGFCGAQDSICGIMPKQLIESFLTQQYMPLIPASEKPRLQGILIQTEDGKTASQIKRISVLA